MPVRLLWLCSIPFVGTKPPFSRGFLFNLCHTTYQRTGKVIREEKKVAKGLLERLQEINNERR